MSSTSQLLPSPQAPFAAPSRIASFGPGLGLPAAWQAHSPAAAPRAATTEAAFPQAWQDALRARDMAQVTRLMQQSEGVMPRDRNGATPLHVAAAAGCVLSVRTLLRAGAAPSVRRGDGSTPLHHACAAVQALLLAAGADVGARDLRGRVPLHAPQQMSMELLTAGLNVADDAGFTPLHVAALAGADQKVQWLLDQGAAPSLRSTRLVEHRDSPAASRPLPVILFKAGQRAYDLARFQYHHTRWTSCRHTRTLELLEAATPRAGWFTR